MPPSEKTDKAQTSWSTHDKACSHCRERKIRCGRERPRCANCKRDSVECEYSTPGKRVNHIKLLCNNVGGLEDRLSNIEAELSFMNTIFKTNGNQRLSLDAATEDDVLGETSASNPAAEEYECLPPAHRHILRCSSNLTESYHGPCTLFALCNEFSDTLLSAQREQLPNSPKSGCPRNKKQKHNGPAVNDTVKDLLGQLCLAAGTEESVDLQSDPIPIRLPPKQFLLMAQTQFFQQADYATDIFVQSRFCYNVERVYSRPLTPADEAWAICFNTIILLVLGPESSTQDCDSLIGSQFIRPFLMTVRSALSNPRVLMAAKIINVQALALLSIAAQMYYPLGFAESIFAQACVLARTMGLHQARSTPEGVSPEEAQERLKVFLSLYFRDKSLSVSRGSVCWLPSFDCNLSSEFGEGSSTNSKLAIRIQLAKLQDESYRLLHSADSPRPSSSKYKNALLRIEQGLERWANANEVLSSPYASTRDVDLQLEFLTSRICVLRTSREPNHVLRALNDARASCLWVLVSYGKHEPSMIEQLDSLLMSKTPSKPVGPKNSGRSSKSGSASPARTTSQNVGGAVPSRFRSLLDTFSVPAFFLLASNVISPSPSYDASKASEDLDLLQRTWACYEELEARMQANNHTRKVGRAIHSVLEIIHHIRSSGQLGRVNPGTPRNDNFNTSSSMNNCLAEQNRMVDFGNLPSPSVSSMPPLSWDNFMSGKTSTTTPEGTSADPSPGLLTPLDSQFQAFDPLPQNFYFPSSQQQMMHPASIPRQQLGGSDVTMDGDQDSRLLSDFLANPLSFEITP